MLHLLPISTVCTRITPFKETTAQVGITNLDQILFNNSLGIARFVYLVYECHRVNNEGALPSLASGQHGEDLLHQVALEIVLSCKKRSRKQI
jgi:hypothetical protein